MTTPLNHRLTITLREGKTARASVVYLQPKETRLREESAVVHVTCSEWLDPNWYSAIYVAGERSFGGQYLPHAYELGDKAGYKFMGTFERIQDGSVHAP